LSHKDKTRKEKIDTKIKERPLTLLSYKLRVRWALGISVVILLLFLAFSDRLLFPLPYPKLGEPAPYTIRAPYDFYFDEKSAFEIANKEELNSFIPIFIQDQRVQNNLLGQIKDLIEEIHAIQLDESLSQKKKLDKLKQIFHVKKTTGGIRKLLRYDRLEELGEVLVSEIVTPISSRAIVMDKSLLNKEELRIRDSRDSSLIKLPAQKVYTLSQAKKLLEERMNKLLFNLDPEILSLLSSKLQEYLSPNLRYSEENAREIQRISEKGSTRMLFYRRGDILLHAGRPVTRIDILRLEACNKQKILPYWASGLGTFLPFLALTLFFLVYLSHFHTYTFSYPQNYVFIFLTLLILLLITKVLLLFTSFSGYLIPVSLVAILITATMNKRIALITSLLAALYVTYLTNFQITLFIYYAVGSVVGIWVGMKSHKGGNLFLYSLLLGGANVVVFFCCQLMVDTFQYPANKSFLFRQGPIEAFSSGILAWFFTVLVVPFFEKIFGMASTSRLLELSDLNSPLLKKLQEKAPGTYYHSIGVANLAAAAADAIGVNSLLVRVAGYYHDIGKIIRPNYFIENLGGGENPHNSLSPAMSSHILRSHIKEGIEIAKEYHLPQRVIDLIAQHHGTSVMGFFYNKAQENGLEGILSRDFFRYDGPKPISVESALVLIADATEAVSRTLKNPSYLRTEEMVKEVVKEKFADGQFDECQITGRDLNKVINAITNSLLSSSHQRIEYPKAPEKVKTVNAGVREEIKQVL
jgi:hypothetical protein